MHSEAGFWCGSLKGLLWLCGGIYCEHSPHPHCWKERWQLQHPLLASFLAALQNFNIFWEEIFCLSFAQIGEFGGNGQQQTQTHTPTFMSNEPCCSAPVEILSVCICLCPSSPTTSQSFVMHVRLSIYSLHLHCVLWMWHWSNLSLSVLAETVRHRPVNSSNAVLFSQFIYKDFEIVILSSAGSSISLETVFTWLWSWDSDVG